MVHNLFSNKAKVVSVKIECCTDEPCDICFKIKKTGVITHASLLKVKRPNINNFKIITQIEISSHNIYCTNSSRS